MSGELVGDEQRRSLALPTLADIEQVDEARYQLRRGPAHCAVTRHTGQLQDVVIVQLAALSSGLA